MLSHFITQTTLACCLLFFCFTLFLFVMTCYDLTCFRYKLPFYLQQVKSLSCFLFEYNRLLGVFVPCRLRTSFHFITGHLIQTIRMILHQTDVVKARHCIFFLFWQHQNVSYLLIADWKSNGKSDSLRYLHQRTGFRQSNHPHDWVPTLWHGYYHGWRCLTWVFIFSFLKFSKFQKFLDKKISPPWWVEDSYRLVYLLVRIGQH